MIELRVLGPTEVTREGVGVKLQRKPLALLTYLALAEPRGLHRRDTLLGIFWPDYDQSRARTALRQPLYHLRRELGENVILTRGDDEVGLDQALIRCDVFAFDTAVAEGQLEEAVSIYKGSVLKGLYLNDTPEFEHWLDGQRLPRDQAYANAVEQLAAGAQERGNHRRAADWLHRLLLVDPLDARVTLLLMNTLDQCGDRTAAIHVGEKHVAAVRRELSGEADAKVVERLERLRRKPGQIDTPKLPPRGDDPTRADLPSVKEALDDRYRVLRELGSGVMAKIYLAEDRKLGREVAVKVLKPEYAATVGTERFLREIEIAARLNHPHILALIDSGEAGRFLYYVMPYVAGEALREKIRREEFLEIPAAIRIALDVATALDYSHRHRVVHRDIKPQNILLHEDEALVADFGIALAMSEAGGKRLTESGLMIGTPEYMSPEQADPDRPVDSRSDIYSLGCVLYEMVTGEPVFTGVTAQAVIAKHRFEHPASARIVRDAVSPELADIINKALAKIPADRFDTARDFAARLRTSTFNGTIDGPRFGDS
jgi:DNA-binding SARP family transcriptional activator